MIAALASLGRQAFVMLDASETYTFDYLITYAITLPK